MWDISNEHLNALNIQMFRNVHLFIYQYQNLKWLNFLRFMLNN